MDSFPGMGELAVLGTLLGSGCLCIAVLVIGVVGVNLLLRRKRKPAPAILGLAPAPARGERVTASLTRMESEAHPSEMETQLFTGTLPSGPISRVGPPPVQTPAIAAPPAPPPSVPASPPVAAPPEVPPPPPIASPPALPATPPPVPPSVPPRFISPGRTIMPAEEDLPPPPRKDGT